MTGEERFVFFQNVTALKFKDGLLKRNNVLNILPQPALKSVVLRSLSRKHQESTERDDGTT